MHHTDSRYQGGDERMLGDAIDFIAKIEGISKRPKLPFTCDSTPILQMSMTNTCS